MPTVQGGGVNQDVVAAVARKFTNGNLRAGALEGVTVLVGHCVQIVVRKLLHLLANFEIHRHRKLQTQKNVAEHH